MLPCIVTIKANTICKNLYSQLFTFIEENPTGAHKQVHVMFDQFSCTEVYCSNHNQMNWCLVCPSESLKVLIIPYVLTMFVTSTVKSRVYKLPGHAPQI